MKQIYQIALWLVLCFLTISSAVFAQPKLGEWDTIADGHNNGIDIRSAKEWVESEKMYRVWFQFRSRYNGAIRLNCKFVTDQRTWDESQSFAAQAEGRRDWHMSKDGEFSVTGVSITTDGSAKEEAAKRQDEKLERLVDGVADAWRKDAKSPVKGLGIQDGALVIASVTTELFPLGQRYSVQYQKDKKIERDGQEFILPHSIRIAGLEGQNSGGYSFSNGTIAQEVASALQRLFDAAL